MKRLITYEAAINEALHEEMQMDPRVFVYGIDVADHKRTFGTGIGILEKFGAERFFSAPLSEEALTGFGQEGNYLFIAKDYFLGVEARGGEAYLFLKY